jgi:cytochrome c peroxidase
MTTRRTAPLVLLLFTAACGQGSPPPQAGGGVEVDASALQAFAPLPPVMESAANAVTPEKVALGRMLYYDTRVSSSGDVSCYVCHPLHDYGTSHRRTGVGHDGLIGGRNEPSVYNAAGHVAQFWDGRAADVEAQALGPVLNPVEMGMPDGQSVEKILYRIPGYVDAFSAAFPADEQPVTFENFGRAIAAFERGLVTPSRWDAFLEGDAAALTDAEKTGFNDFVAARCNQCHLGAYVGAAFYQKAGLVNPWYDTSDRGRAQVTGNQADAMVFKVPSLRNVEETWPYFHDGSAQRLQDAIALMGWHQLGVELTPSQVESIATWLRTLSGPVPYEYINEPTLPPYASPSSGTANGS